MDTALRLLAEQPLLLLFVLFAIGTAAGNIRIAGVHIGPAAVLFAAIAITAASASAGYDVRVPSEIGTLGLVLFTYTVGVMSGPSFFAALRTGARVMASVILILVVTSIVAAAGGRMLGLDAATVAGTFAGALTNTPALAAAGEVAGDAAAPTVGYSIAYVFGVLGMLSFAALALRHRDDTDDPRPLTNLTVRVERRDAVRVGELEAAYGGRVAVSRVRHGEDNPIRVADDDDLLHPDDLVTVVGPSDVVEKVAASLGHRSSHTLVADRGELDFRRITLSRTSLAGHTIDDLDLLQRFGATVSRVRRGDVDMVASADLVLLPGDRLRVIAPKDSMTAVSDYLGDSVRGLADINPLGLAVGMALGLFLGEVHIPLPGGGFSVGAAAGTLLVGLALGRVGHIGPFVTVVPHGAASSLSQFGMLAFLAYAGTTAGGQFMPALSSGAAWKIALLGVVLTSMLGAGLLLVMRLGHKIGGIRLSGIIAGSQTQPAVLAFANERTSFDTRVAVGYALVFPVAMIAKILLAQLLAGI